MVSATILPIVLAGPLFFYLTLKLRELAIANHRLSRAASTDSLTECLNRGAFTAAVEAHLRGRGTSHPRGALLVIDADQFKQINDRFGHDAGDEALLEIAAAIREATRAGDLVGRLGGEEFGVFLPDASDADAAEVAERIRRTIHGRRFAPDGVHWRLSASVGGAVFDQPIEFSELFRIADQRLYRAKMTGRNRVEMIRAGEHDRQPAAQSAAG
ncbi:MAG TPA: GGDEF domain-containing protein [Rhizobiales bacterium]|nr:GGDEF domain-containing protein [Hyphomicrobiales bacterium]